MLPRPVSQAYICFQCQLHLLKGPSHTSYFSTATSTSLRRNLPKIPRNFQQRNFQQRAYKRSGVRATQAKPGVYPAQRTYGQPGQQVREDARSFSTKVTLTSPDVIVLRDDVAIWKRPPPDSEAPDLKSSDDDIDIMAVVESERGIIRQPDVDAHIEELRPKEDPRVPLSNEEFGRIWQTLEEGFTIQQLQGYAKPYLEKKARKQLVKKQEAIAKYKALRHKTDWFPDKTKENSPFLENPLRGYSSISHNTKQQTVLLIMRSCWNLHTKDVLFSTGELEMHISEEQFRYLVQPSISPLEPIMAKLRLGDGELIEAFLSKSVLRITANERRAHKIADDINHNVLQRMRSLRTPLTMLKYFRSKALAKRRMKGHHEIEGRKNGFDEKLFKEIEKMTGTTIESNAESAYIWSMKTYENSTCASPAEVARRLIISYYTDFHKELPLMGLRRTNSPEALVKCENLDSLPWYDRLRKWVRRTSAITKSTENKTKLRLDAQGTSTEHGSENTNLTETHYKVSPPLVDSVSRTGRMLLPEKPPPSISAREKERKKNSIRIWRAPYTSSDVTLGQVLHERSNALPVESISGTDSAPKDTVLVSKHQVFSTSVPNLAGLIESMRASNPGIEPKVIESVEMRFEPSPLDKSSKTGTKKGRDWRAFPNVQMRFGIDEVNLMTRKLHFKDIIAIADTSTTHIMLPDRPVDLRFQRRKTYRGRSFKLTADPHMPVRKFLKASQLNLIDGIKTPPGLSILMDRYMCTNLNAWEPKGPENDVMDVEYLFAGMNIKKKMLFDFNGWTLIYTDITSGKAGGRSREIRLRPTPTQSREVNEEDFIKAAFQLTDVVGQVRAEDAAASGDMSNIDWQFQGARREYDNSSEYFTTRLVLDREGDEEWEEEEGEGEVNDEEKE